MPLKPHLMLSNFITLTCLTTIILARGPGAGGGGGYNSGSNSGNYYNPNNPDDRNGNSENNSGLRGAPGFDVASASHYRYVHGILAALAMVLLFPIGSILLRVLPGKIGLYAHAVFQCLALCIYIAAVGLGIYLVSVVRIPGRSVTLLSNPNINYHPIIGLVLFGLFLIQPVLGVLHHLRFRKIQKRQIWSWLHLFNGRVGVTIGIINGALGLNLSNNASGYRKRVYYIVAAVVWVLWMVVAIVAELKRFRRRREEERKRGVKDLGAVVGGGMQYK
ncbi:hypothetical protein QBC38DRAFT_518047 [Podospora fimiseda]|uniref:Cytochrome b561 domain-containing protein n=1 Tax=Podospora fimiseda TaxID=252190 RepID=A0AAN6YRV4_9PEZI|nr:hypothetical protein QBC38DRAFT_518047 [Podospora fimiseda]